MAVIDGIILKGRHVIIPDSLKKKALDQTPPKSHGNR